MSRHSLHSRHLPQSEFPGFSNSCWSHSVPFIPSQELYREISKALAKGEENALASLLGINPGWISECCGKKTVEVPEKSMKVCIHFLFVILHLKFNSGLCGRLPLTISAGKAVVIPTCRGCLFIYPSLLFSPLLTSCQPGDKPAHLSFLIYLFATLPTVLRVRQEARVLCYTQLAFRSHTMSVNPPFEALVCLLHAPSTLFSSRGSCHVLCQDRPSGAT